ncbi:MAG: cyanophycinase [Bdellovibrionia bacterium]
MNRLILALLFIASSAVAQERLIVLGGSLEFPKEAVTKFVEWTKGKSKKAKVLVIPWATRYPDYAENIIKQLKPHLGDDAFVVAPGFPLSPARKKLFLKQLEEATGVFFTGGGQERILKTIEDNEIRSAIAKKFKDGTPFAGTSAGTAIMSNIAIIAENDPTPTGDPNLVTGPGLCLLPSHVIVDQHFIVRDREARLKFLMMANPGTIGVGIDEPAGFIVEDGVGKAVGPSAVVVLTPQGKEVLKPGDKYNLMTQKRER